MIYATALLSNYHIYKSYGRLEDITVEGPYRDTIADGDTLAADTVSLGNLPWREVFTDARLQMPTERILTNNADLRSVVLIVRQARAALMSVCLTYTPVPVLPPQRAASNWDKGRATQTYSFPVTTS